MFERGDEIFVVRHTLFVTSFAIFDLLFEACLLVNWVIELGEGIAELITTHTQQLEPFDIIWRVWFALGER